MTRYGKCRKCGADTIAPQYNNATDKLKYECHICGFKWETIPNDFVEEKLMGVNE